MSFAAAVTMLVANVLPQSHAAPRAFVPLGPADLAAERGLMLGSAGLRTSGFRLRDEARLVPPEDSRPDLVLQTGDRRHGAQVEIGALGGGRSDAPGLLHVGVGLDF